MSSVFDSFVLLLACFSFLASLSLRFKFFIANHCFTVMVVHVTNKELQTLLIQTQYGNFA